MKETFFKIVITAMFFIAVMQAVPAPTFLCGNDNPRGSPVSERDFQDMCMTIDGATPIGVGTPIGLPSGVAPLWAHSDDGPQLSAGWFITGTGGWAGNPASPNWSTGSTLFWLN